MSFSPIRTLTLSDLRVYSLTSSEPRLYGRNLFRTVQLASNHWILDWNVEPSPLVAQLQRKSQLQQVSPSIHYTQRTRFLYHSFTLK